MKLRNVLLGAVALGLMSASTMASAATWRFGLEEIKGSVQYQYAEDFKKLIEQKSNGDIKVQLLPYGKWGSTYSALYDAIQSGAIQIGFGSGALGGTVPESQLLSLNFVMPSDQWQTVKVLNSPEFLESQPWQQAFKKRGLVPLAELTEGYQVWTANKPIHTPADMKGLQIRVMDNSLLRATYKAYGANPISIAYGELYSALQQGQAEGNIQPVFAHEEMGFYEVQKDMIFADQSQFVATLMGNKDWWQGLSADQKKMVKSVTQQMVKKGYDVQKQFNDKRLQTIKDKSDINIIHLDDQQRDQFRKLAKPVRQVYVNDTGELGKQSLDILLKQFSQSSGSNGSSSDSQSADSAS
ncbi:TRAP transporter substrate-binding protein DctP [Salinisphaera sp. Q1T1-3]|uniref:TRAP transporter substrate-binding protein DctP n=1 Tax=Salinisphaera sp. Q1T1-3 TaxID=2321229 RepID=UPI000E71EDEE|nr:TRAP transporter substrate-binding protein DctP [Salinisphaera sp. Q1T1-3]RJS91217.1 C4-dicarboxylate ABC transporter substrate-binding protein [Salinisphaera sp. Q1T1-3]